MLTLDHVPADTVPATAPGPTVGRVIAELGATTVEVLCAAAGALDVHVRRTRIWDAGDSTGCAANDELGAGDLVLAVGLVPASPQLSALLVAAREARVAAVAIRGLVNLAWVRTEAERLGVTVLVVSRDLAWDQVHGRARAIMASPETTGTGPGGSSSADLHALANTAAAALGGPVEIDDAAMNLLAFSNLPGEIDDLRTTSILTRLPPPAFIEWLRDSGALARVRHAGTPVRIHPPGSRPRLVAPVRAGIDLLGYVWLAEGAEPLRDRHGEILAEVARMVSSQLMRSGSRHDPARRLRDELLAGALDGVLDGAAGVPALAAHLGVDRRCTFTVLGVGARHGWADPSVDLLYVRDQLEMRGELSARPGAAAVITSGQVYVLLPPGDGRGPDPRALGQRIVGLVADQLGRDLVIAIGDPDRTFAGLHEARREIDRTLGLLAGRSGPTVATCAELRPQATLALLQEMATERPALLVGPIRELAEIDRTRRTDYLGTLRAYFDAASDLTEAARALFVHRNTLRYRLRRIHELCGLDLSDPVQRLVAELQLRLSDDGPGPSPQTRPEAVQRALG